ncbi:MAG: hypothetical protein HQK96_16370 [Nitrospirae bacterium]|nr:hypothetical protein [Nitrospirota bacterium]
MMADHKDIERYVNEPNLLIDLCREVIKQLDSDNNSLELAQMKVQLREISKTIDRLEKMSIPIPEALRDEKINLKLAIDEINTQQTTINSIKIGKKDVLHRLAEEFKNIFTDIRTRLSQDNTRFPKIKHGMVATSKMTDRNTFREELIRALKKFGGKATVNDIMKEIGQNMKDRLLPGDLEFNKDGRYCWEIAIKNERYTMVYAEGILKDDSPEGIWELTDDYL